MAQLRLAIGRILSKYTVRFAPNEGMGESVEADLKDQTTAHPGRLLVTFEKRRPEP